MVKSFGTSPVSIEADVTALESDVTALESSTQLITSTADTATVDGNIAITTGHVLSTEGIQLTKDVAVVSYNDGADEHGFDCRNNGVVIGRIGDANKRIMLHTDDNYLHPWSTNYLALGGTARRWSTVYAQNALDTPSDERLKREISKMRFGIGFINKLDPVTYAYKDDPEQFMRFGFIAQDVQKVLDSYGAIEKNAMLKHEGEFYSMGYTELIAPMVSAIQDLSKEVNKLKKEVRDLLADKKTKKDKKE